MSQEYSDVIFNMSLVAVDVHKATTDGPVEALEDLQELSDQINTILTDPDDLALWRNVSVHIQTIAVLHNLSSNYTIESELFNYMLDEARYGEEINVRLAHDFIMQLNQTETYIHVLQNCNDLILFNVAAMNDSWRDFLQANLSVDPHTIEEWTKTMYQCTASLSGSYSDSNASLVTMDYERILFQNMLEEDLRTQKVPEYLAVSDEEFFM